MNPLRISFPVITCPGHVGPGKGRVILIQMQPIEDARPWASPTNCKAIGLCDNGQMVRFTIPLKVWQDASRNPVHFLEATDVRAPAGALVESSKEAM